MGIIATSSCILFATLQLTESVHEVVYAIWIWAIFVLLNGTPTTLLTTTAKCFGAENQTKNYGLVVTGQAAGGIIMASVTSAIFPQLSYLTTFMITAGVMAVTAVITFFFPSSSSSSSRIVNQEKQRD